MQGFGLKLLQGLSDRQIKRQEQHYRWWVAHTDVIVSVHVHSASAMVTSYWNIWFMKPDSTPSSLISAVSVGPGMDGFRPYYLYCNGKLKYSTKYSADAYNLQSILAQTSELLDISSLCISTWLILF